jgi:ParB-like chromosome segregation protein Spo0J
MLILTQHPLSAAFPAMLTDEFQDLKDSINNIGVQNPITLLDGMVLDGWHRYSIAIGFGMDCPMVELPDDIDPIDFVKAQNSARRHLTLSQTAFA